MESMSTRVPASVVILAALSAPMALHCGGGASPEAGAGSGVEQSDAGVSSILSGAGASATPGASDAAIPSEAAILPGADGLLPPSAYDASSELVAPASDGDVPGAEAAGDDGGADAVWATWPMPNSPSSGLPHPQSYDTSVAGTALDRVTGLMWEREASVLVTADYASIGVLDQASAYCANLALAGFHDWRLPTRIELVSIVDFGADPAENSTVFTVTGAALLSSSQHPFAGATDVMVGVAWMGDGTTTTTGGSVDYYGESNGQLQAPEAVRCVRGQVTPSGPHYTIGGGTVHDNWTGLTWLQSPSGLLYPSDVGSYCSGQTQAGGGWRAPSPNELETLWGDFSNPDDPVDLDPVAFAATLQLQSASMGSSQLYVGPPGGSTTMQWVCVAGQAAIGERSDVYYVPPNIYNPTPSLSDYQVYAQCVR